MTQAWIGSGGFSTKLKRTDLFAAAGPNFLASEDFTVKLGGITLKQGEGESIDGRTIVQAGVLVTPNTDTEVAEAVGRWLVYDPDQPGSDTLDPDLSGYTLESVDTSLADVVCGLIIRGDVRAARVAPAVTTDPADTTSVAIRAAIGHRFTFQ